MKLGKDVHNDQGARLAETGTVLTDAMIDGFDNWGIFSVIIDEPEKEAEGAAAAKVDPSAEHLSNPNYILNYRIKLTELHVIYDKMATTFEIDKDAVLRLVNDDRFWALCHDNNAITQLHSLDRSDEYIIHHSLNMGILAGLMGIWLKMNEARRTQLVIAALLCDSGMLQIPLSIRAKKGKLETDEMNLIRRHTVLGRSMILESDLTAAEEIAEGVIQHHERNDGSGYPKALRKEQIGDFGRILALVDIYDAMASNRNYAKRTSPFDIFQVLFDDIMNNKMDTEYGVCFVKNVCHSLNGAWGMLSNGERAKIVFIDETRVNAMPMVQTESGKFIDLNTSSDVKLEYLLTSEETN
ncbi:MAG: HD domain-containing phosphohydrolase [Selenomonadaceae bacterium]|nr:HD domain-containing phosphohydrolase [Selenomonadaceae bacterium]